MTSSINLPVSVEEAARDQESLMLSGISVALDFVGLPQFYDKLSTLIAQTINCEHRLVMRYCEHEKPVFLLNAALRKSSVDLYLDRLYRLDPLVELTKKCNCPLAITLKTLNKEGNVENEYLSAILKIAFIYDELAVLLPAVEGVTIAVCCERRRRDFTADEIGRVRSLLPLIYSLHRNHIEMLIFKKSDNPKKILDQPIQILSQGGREVFANQAWRNMTVEISQDGGSLSTLKRHQESIRAGQYFIHEQLGSDFPLAPNGSIVKLITRSSSFGLPGKNTPGNASQLTPREMQIVRLIMVGLSSKRIARKLNLSLGTIKNHRHRLYGKLGITEERQLIQMLIPEPMRYLSSPM